MKERVNEIIRKHNLENDKSTRELIHKTITMMDRLPLYIDVSDKKITSVEDIFQHNETKLFEEIVGVSLEYFEGEIQRGLINRDRLNQKIRSPRIEYGDPDSADARNDEYGPTKFIEKHGNNVELVCLHCEGVFHPQQMKWARYYHKSIEHPFLWWCPDFPKCDGGGIGFDLFPVNTTFGQQIIRGKEIDFLSNEESDKLVDEIAEQYKEEDKKYE